MAMVFCPLCRKVHEMDFKQEEQTIPLGGIKIDMVTETITCRELDLQKQNVRLKNHGDEEKAKEGLIKEMWTSLSAESKLKIVEELQRKLNEEENERIRAGKK